MGHGIVGKQAVFDIRHLRTCEVKAVPVDCESRPTVRATLPASVEPGTVVFTDDHFAYRSIEQLPYLRESVNHSEKEFVRKRVHTNGIESVWAAL